MEDEARATAIVIPGSIGLNGFCETGVRRLKATSCIPEARFGAGLADFAGIARSDAARVNDFGTELDDLAIRAEDGGGSMAKRWPMDC